MSAALQQFQANLQSARGLLALYQYLSTNTVPGVLQPVLDDLLRSAWVFAVSDLDQYVHERIREGMLDVFTGNSPHPKTDAYRKFPVSMQYIEGVISGQIPANWLEQRINESHSFKSFQKPEQIAEGLRLISERKLWIEVQQILSRSFSNAEDLKLRLDLIVAWRNQIVHNSDVDVASGGQTKLQTKNVITYTDTLSAIDFIEQICVAIDQVVT
jgi:hypothetical protein